MKKSSLFLSFGVVALIVLAGCQSSPATIEQDILLDDKPALVDLKKIRSGGPPPGSIGAVGAQAKGIPALAAENINFVSVAEADEWIEDNELILALVYQGIERVYPLQIVVWHEIVNDNIAGDPVLITYCPLCGSGIAYKPFIEVNGQREATRFGTSGKLYQSNLIMYDETTGTYWQQIDGKAIVGPLVGQELEEVSIDTVTWGQWKAFHPNSEVLSQDTGIDRKYGKDPYGAYYEESYLLFPVEYEDGRIHPKTQVFGIEVDGVYKAYRQDDVAPAIQDTVGGQKITLTQLEDGRVQVLRNGQEIVKEVDFWFAWYAFHPDTLLYEN